ncbi:hypothetical protein NS206_12110 [Microbacterium testaceum]|nr:hypothetical protein NS206_12110 [Microbacterium testaceum]
MGDSFAASFSLACVAASIPLGLGTRIYQGLQRTQTATALTFVGVGVQVATLGVVFLFHLPAWTYAIGPALALLLTNAFTMILALRAIGIATGQIFVPSRTIDLGQYGFSKSAIPYLITLLGVTLTLQMQRIFLSHASTPDEVASFSFAAQFSVAITSVVTLSSINLWPKFRDLQSAGALSQSTILRFVRMYTVVGVAFGAISATAAYCLAAFVTNGSVVVSLVTAATSGLSIFAWSVTRPAVMFLNSPSGFWLQAAWALPCAVTAVILTLTLGATMGAAGAFLASSIAVFTFTFAPLTIHSLRQIRRPR